MSYTVPLPDGSKVVVLYAKRFLWKDKKQSDLLDDQPISGRIYRALKVRDQNIWYLRLSINPEGKPKPIMDGIRITELHYSTPEWECDFVEIDDMNILDLDITSEDYNQLATWADNNHEDFVKLINGPAGFDIAVSEDDPMDDIATLNMIDNGNQIEEDIKNKIMGVFEKSLIPHTDGLNTNIKYLSMRDPFVVQALRYLTNKYIDDLKNEDSVDFIPLSREIALSDEYGKGANIHSIIQCIEKYAGTKGNKNDLAKAARFLIFELIRLEITK